MKFGAPDLMYLLWLIPVFGLFQIWADAKRKKAMASFAKGDPLLEISGNVSGFMIGLKSWLRLLAFAFLLFALLRPQWGFTWEEVKRQGLDIMIALDTSNSMLAEDVLPNRMERSKLAIKDLVKKLRGDRVGLIAFSGTAFLQCPLTIDYNGFLLALNDVGADTIPVGGTSIANAIYTALGSYEGGGKKHRILIIITDGEDLEGGVEAAVMKAKAQGVTIYCVGIGTREGELIPVRNESGKMEFLKDLSGNVVRTRLDEESLQKAAIETDGMYVRATGAEFGLDLIYEQKLSKFEKDAIKSRMEKRYNEKFQVPLSIAIFLLFIEALLGDRRKEYDR